MPHEPNDPLEKLLGDVPVDDVIRTEHRASLRADVLDEFDATLTPSQQAAHPRRNQSLWRTIVTHPAPRWTALCLTLTIALGWFFWPSGNGQAFALDEMVDSIVEAKTVKCQMEVEMVDLPTQRMTAWFADKGRLRQEFSPGVVNVSDFSVGKMVNLDQNTMTATVFNLQNLPTEARQQRNEFELLRMRLRDAMQQPDDDVQSLGKDEIDGRPAVGFPPAGGSASDRHLGRHADRTSGTNRHDHGGTAPARGWR